MVCEAHTLVLYTTATCNLNCSYCYIDKNPALVEIDKILDESFKGDYYINFIKKMFPNPYQLKTMQFWGGEPTLRLDRAFYTVEKVIQNYPNFSEIMFSTNFAGDYWLDTFKNFMDVLGKYPNRHFIISLQMSIDGPEDINDLGRGKGVTRKFITNFQNMVKKIADDYNWIPQNVSIDAFFKPTLSIETLPLLQTKESILRYYQFFEVFKDMISYYEGPKINLGISVPNTACPSPHTVEDGKLMANYCRITRLLERENKTEHYFKYYKSITPFEPHGDGIPNNGCANMNLGCGNCGMGTLSIGLLPWNRISLCHNGFVDLISEYKKMCLNDENLKNHSIDSVLFDRNNKMRDTNCTLEEFDQYQKMLLKYQNQDSVFKNTQTIAQIMNLAKFGMIDSKYSEIHNACDATDFLNRAASYCVRDNIATTGSTFVTPIGLAKLLLNGAKEYITYENTDLD